MRDRFVCKSVVGPSLLLLPYFIPSLVVGADQSYTDYTISLLNLEKMLVYKIKVF